MWHFDMFSSMEYWFYRLFQIRFFSRQWTVLDKYETFYMLEVSEILRRLELNNTIPIPAR